MNRKATIKDIAKMVGVTPATVSYVLSGTNRVSQATRTRVMEAVKQLNYVPNMSARGLARNRSYTIGLFIPMSPSAFLDPFFAEILRGLTEVSLRHQYTTSIVYATEFKHVSPDSAHHVLDRIDGLILTEIRLYDKYIKYFKGANIPFVSAGRGGYADLDDYVFSDASKGIQEAMKYLFRLGHRRIGLALGPAGYFYVQERYRAYRQNLQALGLEFNMAYIATGENSQAGGRVATARILRASIPPTAIIATTDVMAMGIIEYLQGRGMSVPGDMSVVGYDDAPMAKYLRPSLTTVRQNVYELGRQAATMLIARLDGLAYKKPVGVPVKFVVRESTAPPHPNSH